MADVKSKNVRKFFDNLAGELDIPESRYEQAEKRYQALGRWLSREGSVVAKFSPEVYTQGSFRLGTVIRPASDGEEYDLDLACELSIEKGQITQKQLKELIGHEVKGYAKANNMESEPVNGRRCWTLDYSDDAQFHMDILPAVPDGSFFKALLESRGLTNDWSDLAVGITDKKLPNYDQLDEEWLRSNPRGYSEWFKGRMKIRFDEQRQHLAKSIRANVEEVPDYKVKTPLQRSVQILKRHRDIMFANDTGDKPISIIITTLAAHAYNNEADLLDSLVSIVNGMPNFITNRNGETWIENPSDPTENFADKWKEHPQREVKFKTWLARVKRDLLEAIESSDLKSLCESFGKKFGEKLVARAASAFIPVAAPAVATGNERTRHRVEIKEPSRPWSNRGR